MADAAFATTHVACRLCGSGKADPFIEQNSCRIVVCRGCGLVYVNPRPVQEAFSRLYEDYHPERMEAPESWQGYMREVFRKTADALERMLPGKGRSLDMGCAFGFFIQEMRRRGWRAEGLDISAPTVEYARALGLDVGLGTIEEAGYPDASFDAVTMFYVLEHLPEPVRTLKAVFRALKPGGVLAVRVPHTTPIVRVLKLLGIRNNLYDPPYHLSDFSPATTRMVLEKAGFTGVRTVIGGATLPDDLGRRLVSRASTALAEALYSLTFGRYLLPGVSKTTFARKPA